MQRRLSDSRPRRFIRGQVWAGPGLFGRGLWSGRIRGDGQVTARFDCFIEFGAVQLGLAHYVFWLEDLRS
jgi:hypothetical protein